MPLTTQTRGTILPKCVCGSRDMKQSPSSQRTLSGEWMAISLVARSNTEPDLAPLLTRRWTQTMMIKSPLMRPPMAGLPQTVYHQPTQIYFNTPLPRNHLSIYHSTPSAQSLAIISSPRPSRSFFTSPALFTPRSNMRLRTHVFRSSSNLLSRSLHHDKLHQSCLWTTPSMPGKVNLVILCWQSQVC